MVWDGTSNHITYRETYLFSWIRLPNGQGGMPPKLRYIDQTTRGNQVDEMKVEETFLMQRGHSWMMFDLELCLDWGMKTGQ